MYFVSINAGAQLAIILLACEPCVVIVNCLGHVLYMGRAPHTKETLLDFREWCRVTRHPRIFRGLTGYQRVVNGTPRFWGVTLDLFYFFKNSHIKDDPLITNNVIICVYKFFPDAQMQHYVINTDLQRYTKKKGAFGKN